MAVYVVTGKLGAGKTLVAVGKIKDKLNQGCKVATNLDLNLDKLIGENAKATRCYRIPDKPVLADLESIGTGTDSYDENKNGLLVLDECGTWFNARSWNDKSRQDVINWFLHARKLGWDIIFLIQDFGHQFSLSNSKLKYIVNLNLFRCIDNLLILIHCQGISSLQLRLRIQ